MLLMSWSLVGKRFAIGRYPTLECTVLPMKEFTLSMYDIIVRDARLLILICHVTVVGHSPNKVISIIYIHKQSNLLRPRAVIAPIYVSTPFCL